MSSRGRGPRPASAATAATRTRPHEVRIIGGRWKRTKLPVANLPGLRPTADRVRETLFNWLGQDLTGWRVLDAFAGTGALGFEAASRSAAQVVMIERAAPLVATLRDVKDRLSATMVELRQGDALAVMRGLAPASFDLVLLDPPFDAEVFDAALAAAAPLVAEGGFVYLEADRPFGDEAVASLGLAPYRRTRAGAVHAHLWQRVTAP